MVRIDRDNPIPLHYQFRGLLQEKIEKEWKPGTLIPGEERLCQAYGLSQVTVRRALSDLTQEGFLDRYPGKGTFVCEPRKHPQTKTTHIGLAVYNLDYISNPFFSKIISGIGKVFHDNDCDLRIFSTNGEYAKFKKSPFYLRPVEEKSIKGLLLLSQELPIDKVLELRKKGLALVLIDDHIPGSSLNCVFLDNVDGDYKATEYLIELGHKRIAFITGPQKHRSVQERVKGYKLALDKHNLPYDKNLILESPYENNTAYQATKELLKLTKPPTAVLAGDDTIAVKVIKEINEEGLKVPDDISVMGFNDMLDPQTKPSLTTMRAPMVKMGELAAQMLLKLINKEEIKQPEVMLKTKLAARQTCRQINTSNVSMNEMQNRRGRK